MAGHSMPPVVNDHAEVKKLAVQNRATEQLIRNGAVINPHEMRNDVRSA